MNKEAAKKHPPNDKASYGQIKPQRRSPDLQAGEKLFLHLGALAHFTRFPPGFYFIIFSIRPQRALGIKVAIFFSLS
jgi:hypothetical protein